MLNFDDDELMSLVANRFSSNPTKVEPFVCQGLLSADFTRNFPVNCAYIGFFSVTGISTPTQQQLELSIVCSQGTRQVTRLNIQSTVALMPYSSGLVPCMFNTVVLNLGTGANCNFSFVGKRIFLDV